MRFASDLELVFAVMGMPQVVSGLLVTSLFELLPFSADLVFLLQT